MNTSTLDPTDLRIHLREAGFDPISCRGKNPGLMDNWAWQKLENVTAEQIAMWGKSFPDARNTSILTKHSPSCDIDILHPEAAEACEEYVKNNIADGVAIVRIGLAPKRAIPFRTDAPFKKIAHTFQGADGSEQKLEFLGDGQQMVCFGVHPETKKEYRWHGGQPGNVERSDLPLISEDEARKIFLDLSGLLVSDFGFVLKRATKGKNSGGRPRDEFNGEEPTTFWGRVNQAALQRLGAWVPKMFPDAIFYENTGAYRIKPEMLKRSCQEDLSITPRGITDWGTWDTSDEREGRRSAIDIVMEWGQFAGITSGTLAWKEKEAAHWLCEQLSIEVKELGWDKDRGVRLQDLFAYMPSHQYIFAPTRELWPSSSVNARIPPVPLYDKDGCLIINKKLEHATQEAATWLDQNQPVEQMTWVPGRPMLIKGHLINEGGWINRDGVTVFNQYRGPVLKLGSASLATRWLDHIRRVYPTDADHIITWLAFKVQNPHIKINHALFLGGNQGVGKDTILEPVKHAVGPWNFQEVSPQQILGRFNSFVKSVILRVSEARDLGEVDRFALYDHLKTYTAAPPDVLRVDEKHLREHYVFNVCGLIITSNHKLDGIYLPADDRRHYVAWTDLKKEDFTEEYWNELWGWYEQGGIGHVAAYLTEQDLSGFNPKAPPPKTQAFWEIVTAGAPDENSELRDIIEQIGNPTVLTIKRLADAADGGLAEWLGDRRSRRAVRHRLEAVGYVLVPNPDDHHDGHWKIDGRRQAVYGRSDIPAKERLFCAEKQSSRGSSHAPRF